MSLFAFNLPPLPGSTGGMPVQLVINSPSDFEQVFKTMEAIKDRARKSGLFIVTDSDLAFNNPTVHLRIDRSKANDLGITMADVGSTLALLVGENYVNRFNLQGRSYEVIPQVPRAERLTARAALALFRQDQERRERAAVDRRSPSTPVSTPMRSPSTTS